MVGVSLLDKDPCPAGILPGNMGKMEWVMDKGNHRCHLQPGGQLHKRQLELCICSYSLVYVCVLYAVFVLLLPTFYYYI